jgi:hypothetical protein
MKALLDSLSDDERQELLTALLREHFSAGEQEMPVHDDEGLLLGYVTTPGIHTCYQLGIDPREMPPELVGPYYPAGYAITRLQGHEHQA